VDDKTALKLSNAGMRLIAQTTIVNSGDTARLRDFVAQNYAPKALEDQTVDERIESYQEAFSQTGKLRIFQVLATDKHRVVVIMQAQADDAMYYTEIAVEEDFPHKIITYVQRAL
jgi:hypothetical protein